MERWTIPLVEVIRAIGWSGEVPDRLTVAITGVAMDSRRVEPGNLFVALLGESVDGHRFIPQAIARGAAAVIGTQPLFDLPVPYFQVTDARLSLAQAAAAFYGYPARQLTVIGVTGTDGKTTTCNLIYHILRAAGLAVGMISTVNAQIGDQVLDTGFHVTTPEAPDIQRYLWLMVRQGLTHVILEATSHGLAQQRVAACDFDLAVVTNITHEHLDYHGTYEAYRQAKGQLFSGLESSSSKPFNPPRGAVLNRDDASYTYLESLTALPKLSYGYHPQAAVRPQAVELKAEGMWLEVAGIDVGGQPFQFGVQTPLQGAYNVSNCLAAIALTRGMLTLPAEAVIAGLRSFQGVPGRMERIEMGQEFLAIVDFAHTPNALRAALTTARQLTQGRVIAVFGSAGRRDRQKRRMMAEVAAELADLTILTAEDPRTESLAAILEEMAAGMRARGGMEGRTFWREPDRRQALRRAVRLARPGDLVIACGKGHEQSMCFGETEYPWDDRQALRAALAELLEIPGPAMPYLPEV